jgi:hypothetical protein
MSKVTITIDDTNAAIVAAFGENSLDEIANQLGYMEKVEKSEAELPEKVEVEHNVGGETETVLEYPEGTEMYKDNPQTRGEFVGAKILETKIIPELLSGLRIKKTSEAMEKVNAEMGTATDILKNAATVTVE